MSIITDSFVLTSVQKVSVFILSMSVSVSFAFFMKPASYFLKNLWKVFGQLILELVKYSNSIQELICIVFIVIITVTWKLVQRERWAEPVSEPLTSQESITSPFPYQWGGLYICITVSSLPFMVCRLQCVYCSILSFEFKMVLINCEGFSAWQKCFNESILVLKSGRKGTNSLWSPYTTTFL